jgi:type I restriction enzyme S subunit
MVEWKELNDFLNFEQPTPYLVKSTEYDNSYKTPVLTAGQSLLLGYTNELDGIYEADKDNPCIIFDDFTTSFHWIDYSFKVKSSAMKMLKPKANTNFRYVYYAMQQIRFVPQQHQRHWISKYSHFQIPVPSLEEQKRIVGILDTFTDSIENLKQQIAQRRKQYEHYRDQLLDLEGKEGVEIKTIQDISKKICSGGTPSTSHKEYYNGNIPWLRTQEVDWKEIYDTDVKITEEAVEHSSAKLIPVNCVIVAMYGATAAKSAINKIALTTNQACCNLEIDGNKALYKYVYYWFCKEYLNLKSMGEGSQNNINGKKIKTYPILLPPLSEQQRIVSLLDTFEASISNLEAQLAQRQKQYEYYRNQLLTFE